MPVKKQLRVEARNHYSKGIRKGDELTLPRGISGIVESMVEKQAYIHITLVGGTKGRLPLGSEINVDRQVATQDEQDQVDMEMVVAEVQKHWEHSKKSMASELCKLNDRFKEAQAKGYLNPFDLGRAFSVKLAELEWRLWEQTRSIMLDSDLPHHRAALRAVLIVRSDCKSQLTKRYQNALSRSTSVSSNLEEDMTRQVMAEFLAETEHWNVEDLWERNGKGAL